MSTFWRVAGMDFLQYQNVAAKTLRASLKEQGGKNPPKARDAVHYRVRNWQNGVKGDPRTVNDLLKAKPKSAAA